MVDYTVLYTIQQRINNGVSANCSWDPAGGQPAMLASTLRNTTGSADTSQSGFIIFPTSVSGIGISVNSTDAGGAAIPAWPDVLVANAAASGSVWRYQNVIIRLWKIPGDIPSAISPVAIIGPSVVQGVVPTTSADYFSTATATSSQALSSRYWMVSERNLIGNASYYIGTCNLKNGNQIVLLGEHTNFTRRTSWRDASFTLDCPVAAYGYGGQAGGSSRSNTANKAPSLKIVPRTAVIFNDDLGNLLDGTISLDAGGAQGYGVQIAWGDYATQTSGVNPARPVTFNTPLSLPTLVSGYPATVTSVGSKPQSATVKMAARFIRTEAVPQAGPATAAVEVIVNYE